MMEWALVILFGIAAGMLILSYTLTKKAKKAEQRELELYSVTFMEEINKLQQQMRKLELDNEILANQTGIDTTDQTQRELLRDVLDLYKRGYSIASIADEKQLSEIDIQSMLSPFMKQTEGRKVAQ
ncbi:hypothetical protein [Bacillus nitroreducens]